MMFFLDGTAKRVLHSITVRQTQQMMNRKPGGALPARSHPKITLIVVKVTDFLREKVGNVSRYKRIRPILTAVHKHPFLLGMRVEINKHKALLLLSNTPLCVVDLRTIGLVIVVPHPVEVVTRKAAPVVTVDDPVRVKHWHQLEYELLPQLPSFLTAGE
jgi:hypothetical protein